MSDPNVTDEVKRDTGVPSPPPAPLPQPISQPNESAAVRTLAYTMGGEALPTAVDSTVDEGDDATDAAEA